MKARIPISRRQRRVIEEAVYTELKEQEFASTQRVFKLFCYVLHHDYGFKKRCFDVIDKVSKLIKEQDEDLIFWEHLDKYVIDQIGMPFSREKIDLDGNLVREGGAKWKK